MNTRVKNHRDLNDLLMREAYDLRERIRNMEAELVASNSRPLVRERYHMIDAETTTDEVRARPDNDGKGGGGRKVLIREALDRVAIERDKIEHFPRAHYADESKRLNIPVVVKKKRRLYGLI